MLIKTENFDKQFMMDLNKLAINRNNPPVIRGSYKIKKIGSKITDIDIAQFIYAENGLLNRLTYILEITKNSNFIFTNLHCGMYNEFKPPWSIDGNGSCDYNPKKVKHWVKEFGKKNLVDEKTYEKIKELLCGDNIRIQNLLTYKNLIRPFSEILWNFEDIKKGYKEFRGEKYELISLMQKGHVCVMRFVYVYDGKKVKDNFNQEKRILWY